MRAIAACWARRERSSSSSSQKPRVPGLLAGVALVREEEGAEGLLAVPDGHAEEVGHVGVRGGPAAEAGVLAYVGEPLGALVVEHRGEDAVLAGQGADAPPLLLADAVHDELGEAAVVVGDAQGRVLGVQELPRGDDDRPQDVVDLQAAAHGQQRGTDGGQSGAGSVAVHGLTVPAALTCGIGLRA